MIVIGLTGGIGAGKSEASRILQGLGAVIISADQVGHQAYDPGTEAWQEVVRAFGEEILQPDGSIDRKQLGGIVFSDPAQLETLNRIMHPRMARMVAERIEQLRAEGAPVVVVEAAVLFEAGWDSLVDEVWTVDAPVEAVVRRLQARNVLSESEVRKRIGSQMTSQERARRADVVIDNSGDVAALQSAIESWWDSRVKEKVGKV
jgi:dephospho-CoA kinase